MSMNRLKCCVVVLLSLVFGFSGVLQPFALYAETLDLAQEQPKVSQPANESASSNVSADTSGDQAESDSAAQDPSTLDSSEAADAESASADAAADEVSNEAPDDDIEASLVENSWRYADGSLRSDLADDYGDSADFEGRAMHSMPKGATAQGIDVSEHNGTIDWQSVKDAGIDFAILRVGFAGDTNGGRLDNFFKRNVSECERLGIPYGVYLYSYARNEDDAQAEARLMLSALKGHSPTLPVYYDLEEQKTNADGSPMWTPFNDPSKLASIAKTFCGQIAAAGYKPGIYANVNWFKNYLTDPCFLSSGWSIWTAQYWYGGRYDESIDLAPEAPAKYDCWQYSARGSVPGVNTDVDVSYWYGEGFSSSNEKKYSFIGVKLSKSEGVLKGDTVSISAEMTGETSGLQYKFYWQKQGTGADAGTSGVIAGPSENSSAEWTVDGSGTYKVGCDVIDSKGVVTKSTTCTVDRYTVDGIDAPSSARAGQGVSLKARVSGDASGLKYKFVWQKDDWKKWGVVGGSSQDSPEATWTPTEPGDYTVTLDVIDGAGAKHATARVIVYDKYRSKGVTLKTSDDSPVTIGVPCTIHADFDGDTSGFIYKFVWEKDNWKSWGVLRPYGDSSQCDWTPSESGKINIWIDFVDADGIKSTVHYPVEVSKESYSYDSLSCNTDLIQQGETVSVDASTSGQTDYLTYKFVWTKNNWAKWGVAQKGKSPRLDWTPSEPGDYTIYCDAIASDGSYTTKTVSFGVWGYSGISVKTTDSNWSWDISADLGSNLASKAGSFKFKFVWTNSSWSKWGVLKAASSENSAHLNPSALGLTYGYWYVYVDVQYPDGSWHTNHTSVWVGYRGYQNPSSYYQVSCASVTIPHMNQGIFGYRTPSRIGTYATRQDCINAMITRAYDYVGTTPYIWDYSCAPGVGVDCAGLVMQCLYATGMNLGRYTPWDHYYTPGHDHYANDMWNDPKFKHLSFSQRQRGDLICYKGHIAIYIGNDQIIEASSPRNGVRVHSVYVGYEIRGVLRPFV